jgi:hypothetical protein
MTQAAQLAQYGANNVGLSFKNRIINGDMTIDQRNAGASVTITNTVAITYTIDRWWGYGPQASKFSVQQDAGAVTPPVGFTDYLGCTSLSAYSVSGTEAFSIGQTIEGFNIADLGFGTANAQTVTVSFWVRSSLTGTFGGNLRNGSGTRSYPFSYTITAANTWEQKSVTIAGDTSGSWQTNNTAGLNVGFSLGAGASASGTAGSWQSGNLLSATGATSVVGTNGATFYITGVQLEKGSVATSFDYLPYGTELALCQRYYQQIGGSTYGVNFQPYGVGCFITTTAASLQMNNIVTMRAAPTFIFNNATTTLVRSGASAIVPTSVVIDISSQTTIMYTVNVSGGATAGNGTAHYSQGSTGPSLTLSAEL